MCAPDKFMVHVPGNLYFNGLWHSFRKYNWDRISSPKGAANNQRPQLVTLMFLNESTVNQSTESSHLAGNKKHIYVPFAAMFFSSGEGARVVLLIIPHQKKTYCSPGNSAGDLFGMVKKRDPKSRANRELQRSGNKKGHELNKSPGTGVFIVKGCHHVHFQN